MRCFRCQKELALEEGQDYCINCGASLKQCDLYQRHDNQEDVHHETSNKDLLQLIKQEQAKNQLARRNRFYRFRELRDLHNALMGGNLALLALVLTLFSTALLNAKFIWAPFWAVFVFPVFIGVAVLFGASFYWAHLRYIKSSRATRKALKEMGYNNLDPEVFNQLPKEKQAAILFEHEPGGEDVSKLLQAASSEEPTDQLLRFPRLGE